VLDFTPVPVPYLLPERPAEGVEVYRPDVPDFLLVRFATGTGGGAATGGALDERGADASAVRSFRITGPAIALCTAGSAILRGESGEPATLSRGDAAFVTPDEGLLAIGGEGEVFLATTGA